QCDVYSLGSTSPVIDAELCASVSDALMALGFDAFQIRINHRQLLASTLRSFGVPDELHESALIALDKLDKVGRDGVMAELEQRGISQQTRGRLDGFLAFARTPILGARAQNSRKMLAQAQQYLERESVADATDSRARDNLDRILEFTEG